MPAFGKRRALGQHFLRDRSIVALIADTAVEEAQKAGCHALLEIGPGKGAITHSLIEHLEAGKGGPALQRFLICERDRALASEWRVFAKERAKEATTPEISLEEADFLDLSEDFWLASTPLAVASNLPYSAGTAILTRLARHPRKIPCMVLMFQAEVAARLRAEPRTKAWGSLSIWIQNRWQVRKLCAAPPGAFAPPPDVNSEVVVLTARETPLVAVNDHDEAQWEGLLKGCFAHRRKMLRSGLNGVHREALERSNIDGKKRAEELTWDEWCALFTALTKK